MPDYLGMKNIILSSDLYHPAKSFDEKLSRYETYHTDINKNEIPYKAFRKKMALDPIPDELKLQIYSTFCHDQQFSMD